ncbi:MAG: hypothetical protein J6S41_03220, partial [Clostridia bacterium]|nr:hypothetical protein [Clostridia bacterium]
MRARGIFSVLRDRHVGEVLGLIVARDEIGDKIVDLQTIKWYFLEALYRQYEHDVYKVCLYFAKDEHIAKDMTQKT